MGIYSKDLSIRAVDAVDRGIPRRDVVEAFSISLTTLKRWLRMRREGKRREGKKETSRRALLLRDAQATHPRHARREEGSLWSQLEENDDDATTLERHCELCGKRSGESESFRLRDESGHTPQARVDLLQKKTLGATERDEEQRGVLSESV